MLLLPNLPVPLVSAHIQPVHHRHPTRQLALRLHVPRMLRSRHHHLRFQRHRHRHRVRQRNSVLACLQQVRLLRPAVALDRKLPDRNAPKPTSPPPVPAPPSSPPGPATKFRPRLSATGTPPAPGCCTRSQTSPPASPAPSPAQYPPDSAPPRPGTNANPPSPPAIRFAPQSALPPDRTRCCTLPPALRSLRSTAPLPSPRISPPSRQSPACAAAHAPRLSAAPVLPVPAPHAPQSTLSAPRSPPSSPARAPEPHTRDLPIHLCRGTSPLAGALAAAASPPP